MSRPLVDKLSDLTPPVVDHLYGIDRAAPQAAPTFVLIVGSRGVGKSSGHAFAVENGFVPSHEAGGYATINLDTLLESLVPFRAASAMAHVVTHNPSFKELVKFSTLPTYMSRYENLGGFKWYDTDHNAIKVKDSKLTEALNSVRQRFLPLRGVELPKGSSLVDITKAAIERAVERSVPIIYETTLSLNKKEGRVKKVDELIALLAEKGPQYHVVLIHMIGAPEEIAMRVHHRQEFGMPYEELPFYRYLPAKREAIVELMGDIDVAVMAIKEQYGGRINVITIEPAMNMSRLPAEREFNNVALIRRIRNVYGPAAKKSSSNRSSGNRTRNTKTSSSESRRRNAATTHKKKRSSSD